MVRPLPHRLRKRDGVWRIVFDYDSDEDGTVGADAFDEATELTGLAVG